MFKFVIAAVALALAAPAAADVKSGVVPGLAPAKVIANLAADCMRRSQSIDEMTETKLTCSEASKGLGAALFTPRGGSSPVLKLRFVALPSGDDTMLQLNQSVEIANALGGVRTMDLKIKDFSKVIVSAQGQ